MMGIEKIISQALSEDIGTGDITTLSTIPPTLQMQGDFIAKEAGVVCGMNVVKLVFAQLDKDIVLDIKFNEGEWAQKGDILAKVSGSAVGILAGERVALNFLQRLSAIATKTAGLVAKLADTKTRVTDTRKTTPGLRVLEKYAVRMGGGRNHRLSLADGILIKDNHISALGGIAPAINAARHNAPHTLQIEVEVETLQQVEEALQAGADIIMLDNMSLSLMKEAVERINGRALVEASGNMGEAELREVAKTGVDLISIGALTHSIKALDISLNLKICPN